MLENQNISISRRDALKLLSLGAGAWILSACAAAPDEIGHFTATSSPSTATRTPDTAQPQPTNPPSPTPESEITGQAELPENFVAGRLTPTDEFYVQNSNGIAKPDAFDWRVNLNGMFDNPQELGLFDLKKRPKISVTRTLECIGNPVGGNLIGNATWSGVSLKALLEEAGIQPEAKYILFLSADDYETSITTDLALDERSLLVYEMNEETLTFAHGFPARLLLPGVYGQKQPKWVVSIRASERDKIGTWENKGWSNEATVQINSKFETPKLRQFIPANKDFFITGIAFADTTGVSSVEISIDDGSSWMPAELLKGSDEGVWTLWNWVWKKPQPGKYKLVARATDGGGITQTASGTFGVLDNVFPNGTSLMHTLSVTVV